jgi:hypothetical protein
MGFVKVELDWANYKRLPMPITLYKRILAQQIAYLFIKKNKIYEIFIPHFYIGIAFMRAE